MRIIPQYKIIVHHPRTIILGSSIGSLLTNLKSTLRAGLFRRRRGRTILGDKYRVFVRHDGWMKRFCCFGGGCI